MRAENAADRRAERAAATARERVHARQRKRETDRERDRQRARGTYLTPARDAAHVADGRGAALLRPSHRAAAAAAEGVRPSRTRQAGRLVAGLARTPVTGVTTA